MRGACLVSGMGLALLPGTARAADTANIANNGAAAFAVIALVVAGFAVLTARRREQAGAARLKLVAAEAERTKALLAGLPGGHWHFGRAGQGDPSSGLGAWLGLAQPPTAFADLAAAFQSEAFRQLETAVAALRRDGGEFALDLVAADGRILQARGGSVGDGDAAVWFSDVSRERNERTRLGAELAAAQRAAKLTGDLLNALPLAVWWRDVDLNLSGCNRAYGAMVELDPDAATAAKVELASSIDPGQPRKLAARAAESAATATEIRHVVVNGDRRALRIAETPVAGHGLIGTAIDVTDLEQAQTDLIRHIDAHAEVLQNLTTAIGIFGADQRLLLFNRAFAALWRLDEPWLAQQPSFGEILELLREKRHLPEQADWQSYKRGWLRLFTSVIEPREELLHLPDERALRLVITPHPFGGLLMTFEDVTDQLVLQRARNTLIAVQRATLDNLYEGVAVYGGDGRLKLWNPGFAQTWRLSDAFLATEPHFLEVVEAARDLLDDGSDWALLRDRITTVFNERIRETGRYDRPDGTVVDYASVPLPDGAVLFSYLDVTDSTRIERALRDRNEALQAADQLKSEFIANVSYELRTPLNTIIGFAEILANRYFGELNQRQVEYADGILESSHHLMLLVNDILDLASIEAGNMVLEPDSFDLHATLEAIMDLTRERARRQDLAISLDCAADIGWIEADERRIKQVLFNLMSNAMKFTPPGGSIALGARRTRNEIALWVADTGVGIPEAELQQVFEKFHKTRAGSRHPGAGLGLSLVRSFVELHGGWVELDSAPDRGTKVTCHIPFATATSPGLQRVATVTAAAAVGGEVAD